MTHFGVDAGNRADKRRQNKGLVELGLRRRDVGLRRLYLRLLRCNILKSRSGLFEREVTLGGVSSLGEVEVLSGLRAGDTIVTALP